MIIKHIFWVHKGNISLRCFFYATKACYYESYQKRSLIGSILWNKCVPNICLELASISKN